MTDIVQKIREAVEKLKSQLLRGACSSKVAMETHCKEEAYNEVLAGMEKMKEQMVENAIDAELYSDGMLTPLIKVNDKEKISGIKFGDKVKIIIIKNA